MNDAPKTIWADTEYRHNDELCGIWCNDDSMPHEYTLTASVDAQLKAADELASHVEATRDWMDTWGFSSDDDRDALTAYNKATQDI